MRGFLIAAWMVPALCFAQAYKCKVDGKTIYQGTPCPDGGEKVNMLGAGHADPSSPVTNYYRREGARLDRQEKTDEAINLGKVAIGMTSDHVVQSWGKPTKINKTINASGTSEQWVYDRGRIGQSQYVYLSNGVVTSIQSPGTAP